MESRYKNNVRFKATVAINYEKILIEWANEWNEDIESCTVCWHLAACPILPGDMIALMFERNILYRTDPEADAVLIGNDYRILLYSTKDGKFISKYRFSIQDDAATTIFTRGDRFYAVVGTADQSYKAVQFYPLERDSFDLGSHVDYVVQNDKGDILVNYESGNGQPAARIFYNDGSVKDLPLVDQKSVIYPSIDENNSWWLLLSDSKTVCCWDNDSVLKAELPVLNVNAVIVNGKSEIFAQRLEKRGNKLYKICPDETGSDAVKQCSFSTPYAHVLNEFFLADYYKNTIAIRDSNDRYVFLFDITQEM